MIDLATIKLFITLDVLDQTKQCTIGNNLILDYTILAMVTMSQPDLLSQVQSWRANISNQDNYILFPRFNLPLGINRHNITLSY